MNLDLIKFIPWLPALAAVLCGLCCTKKALRCLAAPICILSIASGFVIAFLHRGGVPPGGAVVPFFEWINIGGFSANFSYFIDPLTLIMLFVVCGIGTLVAWYAAFYMKGDKGYARFFTFVSLFIFAMTNLVMADNLVLLYLGWEGVGLCSYLLIGYYYNKPSAVAAAKKAFIVNRIGDLGFALGIFLVYQTFGTVSLREAIIAAEHVSEPSTAVTLIPFLLMLGAFGKSAQLPLYVWLPDAMEGPTPVSALIHAATMVTAGVYMIARLLPIFVLSPYALPVVAVVGGLTAVFAATIALCQYDIKRIYAYSTISQLGYMFLGVGALSTVGGVFHLFTHAFFKALLFLTAGSVMHALAGQLDLRKMSGLRTKMPVTCWLMFVGCLALAGFPLTAGFFSKDMILAAVMEKGLGEHGQPLFLALGILGLFTAFLTAFYTFRLWFRVFMGPEQYEMGEEHHGAEEHGHDHGHGEDAKPQAASDIKVEHHHDAHEMPLLMNLPLIVLAAGAIAAGYWAEHSGWIESMVESSTAAVHGGESAHAAELFGYHLHTAMMVISSAISILGIALAAYFHWLNRPAADAAARQYKSIVTLLNNKYYVDEINDAAIVTPLRTKGEIFFAIDRLIIDALVTLVGLVPRALGIGARRLQTGALQGYGLGMACGAAVLLLLVLFVAN
ncbi:MAG: NADH-quinone oxidoreductase subunit L [Planctomycetes bacterium]|nr:NADH-quinone oxidoreductase subunit L [Planctomycetota bacterium]